jgi:hypothetical protein
MGRLLGFARWLAMVSLTLSLGLAMSSQAGAAEDSSSGTGQAPAAKRPVAAKVGAKSKSRRTKAKRSAGAHAKPTASRVHRTARIKTAQAVTPTINENIEITPFPSHAAEARKALAQNRREQLDDAEKAARASRQDDRWQTVLFHLRSFDSRSDTEACFWRVVAYYRLGELARARKIRQSCELPAKDEPIVEQEDVLSASLQPAAALPELAAAGDRPEAPVPNPAGYDGAGPTRFDR